MKKLGDKLIICLYTLFTLEVARGLSNASKIIGLVLISLLLVLSIIYIIKCGIKKSVPSTINLIDLIVYGLTIIFAVFMFMNELFFLTKKLGELDLIDNDFIFIFKRIVYLLVNVLFVVYPIINLKMVMDDYKNNLKLEEETK